MALALLTGGLSGVLLALAYAPASLWWLGWVALCPIFWKLIGSTFKQSLAMGGGFGLAYCALGMGWLNHTTLLGYFGLVLYFTGYYAAVIPVLGILSRGQSRVQPLVMAAAWVSLDFLIGRLFSGIPWLFAGYSQESRYTLIQIADVTGVYGVTFLMAFSSATLAFWIRRLEGTGVRSATGFAGISILIWCGLTGGAWIYGTVRLPQVDIATEGGPIVAVIQPNIPQQLKDDDTRLGAEEILRINRSLSEKAVRPPRPDLLMWAETMNQYPLGTGDSRHYRANLSEFSKMVRRDFGSAFLLGTVYYLMPWEERTSRLSFTNSALLFGRDGEVLGRYDKLHPIPWAEYIPFRFGPIGDLIEKYAGFQMCMIAGEEPTVLPFGENGCWSFGSLICFDVIYPRYARRMVAGGGRFLVNLTNEAWFGTTGEFDQLLAISRFRAIENRVWMLRATNSGISVYINSRGEIEATVRSDDGRDRAVRGILKSRIGVKKNFSLYSKIGDVFSVFCIIFSFIVLVVRLFLRPRKPRSSKELQGGPGQKLSSTIS